jgi:hypothetical protein
LEEDGISVKSPNGIKNQTRRKKGGERDDEKNRRKKGGEG